MAEFDAAAFAERLREQRNRAKRKLWREIQDVVGSHKSWPACVRVRFWYNHLDHFDRIIVTAFCFVNGLNPLVLLEFLFLVNKNRHPGEIYEVMTLFRAFEENPSKYKYYAFNTSYNRYEYIDGSVKPYTNYGMRMFLAGGKYGPKEENGSQKV